MTNNVEEQEKGVARGPVSHIRRVGGKKFLLAYCKKKALTENVKNLKFSWDHMMYS